MDLALHAEITQNFVIPVYFFEPNPPRQQGINEDTNGLIRQYLPKKTDLSPPIQASLNNIAKGLNEFSRKTLKYYSLS